MEPITYSLFVLLACVVLAAGGLLACFVPQMRAAYLSVVDKYEKKKAAQQALAAVALEEGAAAGVAIAPEVLPAKQRLAATPTDKDHGPYQPSWSSQPITVVCCTSAEI